MKRYKAPKVPKKSLNEQIKEDLLFVVIMCAVLYGLGQLIKFIFYPLRWVFCSQHALDREQAVRDEKKVAKRQERIARIKEDPKDPLNAYKLNAGRGDANPYKKWYTAWAEGRVIDSGLLWAPDSVAKKMSFIRYLDIQVNLHEKENAGKKLSQTLNDFYPEFPSDLKALKETISLELIKDNEDRLKQELADEIEKLGLSEEVAAKLSKLDLSGAELRKKAELYKKCSELNYCDTTTELVIDNGLDPNGNMAQNMDTICKDLLMPKDVAQAFYKGLIDLDDIKKLADEAAELIKYWGNDIFTPKENGESTYMTIMLDMLTEIIAEKDTKKGVWEKN